MDDTDLLSRRLKPAGCVIAGHQVAAHEAALAKENITLVPEVAAAVAAVIVATATVEALEGDDTRMTNIDRGADRFINGFDGTFAEIERSFDHADILPLTAAEQDYRDTARALRGRLFANGTDYTRTPYRNQWERMNALHNDLNKPENVSAIQKLGMTVLGTRFERWATLYGAKLGVTEAKDGVDPAAKAVDAWHVAWANLVLDVRSKYRDAGNKEHVKVREMLLTPYEAQANQERADDAKRRAKKDDGEESPK